MRMGCQTHKHSKYQQAKTNKKNIYRSTVNLHEAVLLFVSFSSLFLLLMHFNARMAGMRLALHTG